MSFTLDEVVPWGRSFDEYVGMFALSGSDLGGKILGACDGPASFNAEGKGKGCRIISCDPIYQFSTLDISQRIQMTYPVILKQLHRNLSDYRWDKIASPEELGRIRMAAMERFLDDFPRGKKEGRYIPAGLPDLPFPDRSFDLALCSHFLFTYSEHLSLDFHLQAILELCRVARKVRIFPLVDLGGKKSPHLDPVVSELKKKGCEVSLVRVDYEFQRGANWFIRIISPSIG